MTQSSKTGAKKGHGPCSLCHRVTWMTFHHLIPKKMHRRPYFRKHFAKEQLQAGINLCRPCHSGIHRLYDEMTLAKHYASLQALQDSEAVQRHVTWVKKQKL